MTTGPGDHGEVAEPPAAVFDRMTDAFLAVDDDWRFTYLNERARNIVAEAADLDADEGLEGERLWSVIPELEGTVFEREPRRAMDEQQAVDFEGYYEPLDEWFSVRSYPSESGLSVYFRTVTDERSREARLERREDVLKAVHDAMAAEEPFEQRVESLLDIGRDVLGLGYGTLSRFDGDDYVFEVVSATDDTVEAGDRAPLEATNCERTAATEETMALADIATDAPDLTDRAGFTDMGITCYVGTPVYAGEDIYGTFCFYDTEPRVEPFSEWEVTLVDLLGKWVSYGLDRKLAEDELEAKNERLEEFAMTVSHDLRSPLAVARGNVKLAEDADEPARNLQEAADALDRMDDIITDLLELSKDSVDVESDRIDLAEVSRDSWANVDGGETIHIPEDVSIRADRGSLQRLFENLFQNAVDHAGDEVTVTVGALEDGFYVADDGPGIRPSERDAVFEAGTTSRSDGTGFGLAIVRRIAEEHGWSIEVVESESGGARFEFTEGDEMTTGSGSGSAGASSG